MRPHYPCARPQTPEVQGGATLRDRGTSGAYSRWDVDAAPGKTGSRSNDMRKSFKIHDRVSWNSEAGRVSGTVIRIHTRDFKVNGYTHHATPDEPQYEIKSSKTDHIAFHKASALARLGD